MTDDEEVCHELFCDILCQDESLRVDVAERNKICMTVDSIKKQIFVDQESRRQFLHSVDLITLNQWIETRSLARLRAVCCSAVFLGCTQYVLPVLKNKLYSVLPKYAVALAAAGGHKTLATALLTSQLCTPKLALVFAMANGKREMFDHLMLMHECLNPAEGGNYTLFAAVNFGQLYYIEALLADKRVDPTASRNYALTCAICSGSKEVLSLLLQDPRIDPTKCGVDPFFAAIRKNKPDMLAVLLGDPRLDPSENNNIALCATASMDRPELALQLLADKRVRDNPIYTPALVIAANRGHAAVVRVLLDAPVQWNIQNDFALHLAVRNGHTLVVKYLLADSRIQPASGNNRALRIALENTHRPELIHLLGTNPAVLAGIRQLDLKSQVLIYDALCKKITNLTCDCDDCRQKPN